MSAEDAKLDFEDCFGQWWRADNPDHRLPGTLRRDRDQGTWVLTLIRDGARSDDTRHGVIDNGDTFFGWTSAGDATLLGANLGEQRGRSIPRAGSVDQRTTEVWTAFAAILDGQVEADARWQSIGARVPHAWSWYSPTVLEGGDRPDLMADESEELTCFYGDIEIALWRGRSTFVSRAEHRYAGEAGYSFRRPRGLTVADVEPLVLAINNLHRVQFGRAVSTDVLTLSGTDSDSGRTVTYVHGAPAQVPEIGIGDPFVGTADVSFSEFLPRWISLHVDSPTWPTLGPPRDEGGWLQTNALEAVTALESIAREHLSDLAANNPVHQEILDAAEKGGIRSGPRRHLRRLLELDGPSLTDRLCVVGDSLGKESADWLLGPSIKDWATTVARVRNSLAHGVRAAGGLKLEPKVLIAVMYTARVLTRLTLVRLASHPEAHGGPPGEMLVDAQGKLAISHKNSALAHQMHDARQFRENWTPWANELGTGGLARSRGGRPSSSERG